MQQSTSFVNLSRAIIKKSLERVDSDCVSFGVLDSSAFTVTRILINVSVAH